MKIMGRNTKDAKRDQVWADYRAQINRAWGLGQLPVGKYIAKKDWAPNRIAKVTAALKAELDTIEAKA